MLLISFIKWVTCFLSLKENFFRYVHHTSCVWMKHGTLLGVIYMSSVFLKFYNKIIIIGKCAFRQYIPSKPARYGIKNWFLVNTKSGYLCEVDVYLGKADLESQRETSVGLNVVKQLYNGL